ncbi:DUF1553 domain-containing protein [Flavivirga algicola]|uniref:DUF1553 domain-containing protein n=1 Tax=Flavivirga algicola TaxID=2729136 RepID=A0ABX1RWW8_9FLAO|nr:DUF1553 domain-containing protein [Flavivirga algicola]NMH87533.1 DUF1553 domain-containing protein [Flavivirga algicola]
MAKLKFYFTVFFCALLFLGCNWNLPKEVEVEYAKLPDKIDFNYHVKPILSDKCFACHGPDKNNQKAGLRLDIEADAYRALKSGNHAIVPGSLSKSEMATRIFSKDPEIMMPPPEFNVTLTQKEIATLVKWIEQGAEYKPHWSFIKPKKIKTPKVKDAEQSPIDFFVADKLNKSKLSPSERASKETLIRRVSFGLTGLPPTLEQIENFANDTSKDAYKNLVERLLASPEYGERMTANWLDVARYADSDGYLDDKHRDFSPWRDWVIHAFNNNMPYDEFVTKQLAGDLIPDATTESILATAFNRLHRKNSEAGIVFEEFRTEYVADRTATVSKAFLGLSVECARCHDHKYDPISQKDHYKLSGFFNSTNEIGTAIYGPGQTPGPSLLLTNDEQKDVIDFINTKIEGTEKKLIRIENIDTDAYNTWALRSKKVYQSIAKEARRGLVDYYPFDNFLDKGNGVYTSANKLAKNKIAKIKEPIIKKGAKNKGVFLNEFTTIKLPKRTGWFDHTDPFSVAISVFPDTIYEEATLFYHCEDLRYGLKGYSLYLNENRLKFIMAYSWPNNAIEVITKDPIPKKEWSNITISYDGSGKADGIKIFSNGKEVPLDIKLDNLYKSILHKKSVHTFNFPGFGLGNRNKMKTFVNGGIDELKIYNKQLTELEVLYHQSPNSLKTVLENINAEKNKKLLTKYYNNYHNSSSKQVKEGLRALKKELTMHVDSIPEIMVLGDLSEPRPTYVLDRGAYDALGEEVQPGVPEAVLPFYDTLPKNRLGFSKWLFDKDNPLTARVFVNRIWQMHFGRGIVASSEDFGNQGSLPSHPELLDWLAVTFMESGWDIKKLHKLIVMSATYQQTSKVNEKLLEVDPENVLLARGPSFRLPAEMVRDNALAISGLLSKKIGGRSVYPYQPEGLWEELTTKVWRYKYKLETDENLYRRSMYTIWKRTSPPPSMTIFDVGDRSVCTVKRRQTSTPLQALVLLNDPQFLEAARVLAENVIDVYEKDTIKQLKQAFKISTGRLPNNKELDILERFYTDEVRRFSNKKDEAQAYLNIGNYKSKTNNSIEIAALATVINGIMNTTEGYTLR